MQDIHTHLYWKSYESDRDEVVARAREGGVKEMLVIGCTLDESKQSIVVAEKYPEMYAAVGVHPHEFNEEDARNKMLNEKWIEELKKLAENEKVIAIGECGLDYYSHDQTKKISDEQKMFQKEGFMAQIELAKDIRLPMIIHCRDAYHDMFEIISRYTEIKAFILHCYMGDTEVTKKFLSLPNVYFSFTGNITYPVKKSIEGSKDDLTETVKLIPLDRIFVETDCPFLSPQSKRGERNEPAYVSETLLHMAGLLGIESAMLEWTTEKNFSDVFTL